MSYLDERIACCAKLYVDEGMAEDAAREKAVILVLEMLKFDRAAGIAKTNCRKAEEAIYNLSRPATRKRLALPEWGPRWRE